MGRGKVIQLNLSKERSKQVALLQFQYKAEVNKMAKKLGTKKEVTIEGVNYTFQHPGTEAYLDIQDRAVTKAGLFSTKKMAEELFKHVIIEPKVDFDFFDEHDGFDEVFEAASTFLRTGK